MYDADKPILVGLVLLISALVGILATGIVGGGSLFPHEPQGVYLKSIEIAGVPVKVQIADDEEERVQGLSGRERMAEHEGMLFVFEESERHAIWMKGMKFPLDIFWVNDSGTIVAIWKYAHPSSYPQAFQPEESARYIIEVTSGFADIYNVEVGDSVTGI